MAREERVLVSEAGRSSRIAAWVRRNILYETGEVFLEDRALRLGAGLAYYGVVTAAPLLVLMVGLAGLIVGEEARTGELAKSLTEVFGPEISQLIQDAIVSLDVAGSFTNLTILGVALLFFTASILFVAWKDAMNVIWRVEYRGGVRDTLMKRLYAFAVVAGLAALVIAILVAEALLAMLGGFISDDAVIDTALRLAGSAVPLVLGTLLLGAIFRFGPDVDVSWRDIWPGTLLTMGLLLVVSWGYGVYLDTFGNSSASAVASSAMLLIVLIYLVAQIAMFGAEFIKVLAARRHPRTAEPS
jgi:membrane protein